MSKAKDFLQRFREPSSWAGIAVLLSVFGVPPGTAELVVQAAAAIAAAAAVLLPEGRERE